jgi:hypothetical protein
VQSKGTDGELFFGIDLASVKKTATANFSPWPNFF